MPPLEKSTFKRSMYGMDNATFRRSVFNGDIYILPATDRTRALAEKIVTDIKDALFPVNDIARIHDILAPREFLPTYNQLKRAIGAKDYATQDVKAILDDAGFNTNKLSYDPLRLRAALHKGHMNNAAQSAYYTHRDTWYANPQCQINIWMPLLDLADTQSFKFFPRYFEHPVPNTSANFNYARWKEHTGFGTAKNVTPDEDYPSSDIKLTVDDELTFTCNASDLVIFSASHLHGNCTNVSGFTRYSIDMRVVHNDDIAAGIGAKNVDNQSKGNAQDDYLRF